MSRWLRQLKAADCQEVEVLLDSKHFSFRSTRSKSMMNETQVTLYPEAGSGRLCLYAERIPRSGQDMPFGTFRGLADCAKQAAKYCYKWLTMLLLVLLLYGGACQLFLAPLIE